MAEAWRVLEDADRIGPADTSAAAGSQAVRGRPLWPVLLAGLAVVLAAAAWLLLTGSPGGALTVNAAQAAALGAVPTDSIVPAKPPTP